MTEPEFCVVCERIIGLDCTCVSEHSSSSFFSKERVNGDSGDIGVSPLNQALTSGDLPAVTAVTPMATGPSARDETDKRAVTESGDNDLEVSPGISTLRVTSWTASGLLAQTFPEPRWAVPGIIPEGLTLLAGPPKVGKSWLALDLCVSVAAGAKALGRIQVEPGPVLYLALEDTPRRLQRRLRQVLSGSPAPEELVLAIDCPAMTSGGADKLHKHLSVCEDRGEPARLVVIDVLERVRGPIPQGQTAYSADYAAIRQIKAVADEHGVAIAAVTHVRKGSADDFLSEISGTLGMPGAADTILVLRRSRGEADGTLQITGRDVEEAEYALRFDAGLGAWQLLGLAADMDLAGTRGRILGWIREHPGSKPAQIAAGTLLSHDLVKQAVRRLAEAGRLESDNGAYSVPIPATLFDPPSDVSPLSPDDVPAGQDR